MKVLGEALNCTQMEGIIENLFEIPQMKES
jgi:hypothetical protein